MTQRHKLLTWVTIAVLVHLVVNILHGQAHTRLGVGLNNWQQLFVIVVILIAPLLALALSFTRQTKLALWLLLVSMLGSLIFGGIFHYVVISPDHVAHLPAGAAQGLFRNTALLLVITEVFGVGVAAFALTASKNKN